MHPMTAAPDAAPVLEPGRRYLYARVRGGFTDQMVQLEKCRLYAAEHDRILILDLSRTGLREPLSHVFDPTKDFGCQVEDWSPAWDAALDACLDLQPEAFRGRLSTARCAWNGKRGFCADVDTGDPSLFDFGRDHPAQVLFYEQAGGGAAAFHALQRLRLKPDIATDLARRILDLGPDYDAVHIRHTDYKTDHRRFLTRLRPLLRGRRVLICTDNAEVRRSAQAQLDPTTTVLGLSEVPDVGGKPLHSMEWPDQHGANLALVGDLLALALSRRLVFTRLSGGNKNGVQYSGFSLLAAALSDNRALVWSLLGQAEPEILMALRNRQVAQPSLSRRLRELDLWRWNFGAQYKAWRRNRRIASKQFRPGDIGPKPPA